MIPSKNPRGPIAIVGRYGTTYNTAYNTARIIRRYGGRKKKNTLINIQYGTYNTVIRRPEKKYGRWSMYNTAHIIRRYGGSKKKIRSAATKKEVQLWYVWLYNKLLCIQYVLAHLHPLLVPYRNTHHQVMSDNASSISPSSELSDESDPKAVLLGHFFGTPFFGHVWEIWGDLSVHNFLTLRSFIEPAQHS